MCKQKSAEKRLFEIVKDILENHGTDVDNISIHDSRTIYEEDEGYKVYCSEGYCWEVEKTYICDPDEVQDYSDVDSSGFRYTFAEPWDGFKESGIEKAIEILGAYGKEATNA